MEVTRLLYAMLTLCSIAWCQTASKNVSFVNMTKGGAQISNVSVSQVSATQALLTYTAPNSSACTVQVSQSNTLSPLVHDVDTSLFSGSNSDSRTGSVTSGTSRQVVIGQRAAQSALNGYMTSRALQAYTLHYYQIACGSATASGSFTTSNIPLGQTFNEDVPVPSNLSSLGYYSPVGFYAWPQYTSWTNNAETVIDPSSGIAVSRVSMPADTLDAPQTNSFTGTTNISGHWSNPSGAIGNSSAATATTADWLGVIDQTLTNGNNQPYNYVQFTVTLSNPSGGSADVCITVNGVNCWPTAAAAIILNQAVTSTPAVYTFGTTTPILASWTPAGYSPLLAAAYAGLSDVLEHTGTVNVDSSGNVSYASGTGGSPFNPNWTAGSIIAIGASTCTITSTYVSTLALTITPSACSPSLTVPVSGASYSAGNFGFLVRNHGAAGTLSVLNASWTVAFENLENWPSSGPAKVFSSTETQQTSSGHLGYHMVLPIGEQLYWLDATTGLGTYVGQLIQPSGGTSPNNWGGGTYCENNSTTLTGTTSTAPESIFCPNTDVNGNPIILEWSLSTNNSANSLSMTSGVNLTPASVGADINQLVVSYTSGYTPAFSPTVFTQGFAIIGTQNGDLILESIQSSQDGNAWLAVFNPTTISTNAGCVGAVSGGAPGCIVAAVPSWTTETTGSTPNPGANRWCALHTMNYSGQVTQSTVGGKFYQSEGHSGDNVMSSTVTSGTLSSSPSIAAGSGICPGGSQGCDNLTLASEPCNSSPIGTDPTGCPANSGYGYLMPLIVGDLLSTSTGGGELLKILSKTGSGTNFSVEVQRAISSPGWASTPQNFSGTINLQATCSANAPYGVSGGIWNWNWASDPHGINSGGTTITEAYAYDHMVSTAAVAFGGDQNGVGPGPTGEYGANSSTFGGYPSVFISFSPYFAGVTGLGGLTCCAETAQDHASPQGENSGTQVFYDYRSMTGVGGDFEGAPVAVTGYCYKMSSTTSDGDNLAYIGGVGTSGTPVINRKLQATLAFSGGMSYPGGIGGQTLQDVSGPSSTIGCTLTSAYTYCIARIAGECHSGSSQGDIYWNSGLTPPIANGSYNYGFFNTGQYLNGIAQMTYASNDTTGLGSRMLGKIGTRPGYLNVNSTTRVTPGGEYLVSQVIGTGGAENSIVSSPLPPFPSSDSYLRNTFVPVTLNLTTPSGLSITNAIVEFGYAEDGAPSSYFCTTRQDICTAASATIGTIPFYLASESPAGISCASSCTIELPGISQRAIYYDVLFRTAGNSTVASSGMKVAIVP
jgi:hypothetical protein